MNMNFQLGSCPVCGQMHDDGGWVTRETGERQFVCHDCYCSVCDEPKWRRGDCVRFTVEVGEREGMVDIVDRGGALGAFEHSYDIDGTDGVLYKHVPQRNVLGKATHRLVPETFEEAAQAGKPIGLDLSRPGSRCAFLYPNPNAVVWVMEDARGDAGEVWLHNYLHHEGYADEVQEGDILVWRKG